jgi:hypothetical protein
VARRALQRLEAKGKGILLLHDIHQRTVEALPTILSELKARGFRIVHVVPATAERPATVTAASAWLPNARHAPAAPVILIAEVQDPEGDAIAKKSAMQLCNLNPPLEVASRSMRRHARFAHAELTSRHAESTSRRAESSSRHAGASSRRAESREAEATPRKTASVRSMQPKSKQSKVAHAEPQVTPRDKHSVQ